MMYNKQCRYIGFTILSSPTIVFTIKEAIVIVRFLQQIGLLKTASVAVAEYITMTIIGRVKESARTMDSKEKGHVGPQRTKRVNLFLYV